MLCVSTSTSFQSSSLVSDSGFLGNLCSPCGRDIAVDNRQEYLLDKLSVEHRVYMCVPELLVVN